MTEGEPDAVGQRAVAQAVNTERISATDFDLWRDVAKQEIGNGRMEQTNSICLEYVARPRVGSAVRQHFEQTHGHIDAICDGGIAKRHCGRGIAPQGDPKHRAVLVPYRTQPYIRSQRIETERATAVEHDGNFRT